MAITTLDGLLAGLKPPVEFFKIGVGTQAVGRLYTLNYAAGYPGAMVAPAGGIQGNGLLAYPGCLDWPGNSGNTHLAKLAGECINAGTLLLCDRLWHNSGNSNSGTSAQNSFLACSAHSVANPSVLAVATHGQAAGTFTVHIASSTSTPSSNGVWTATYVDADSFTIPLDVSVTGTADVYILPPPRDRDGTAVPNAASTQYGIGVQLAYEVSGVMGAGTPTLTATYVNSDGTAGKTTPSITLATTMIAGAFIPLPLAVGDKGVRGLYSHTKSATQTSGTYHLVMYRVLASLGLPVAGAGRELDGIQLGLPRLYDNSCLFLVWMPGATAAPTMLQGRVVMAQG